MTLTVIQAKNAKATDSPLKNLPTQSAIRMDEPTTVPLYTL